MTPRQNIGWWSFGDVLGEMPMKWPQTVVASAAVALFAFPISALAGTEFITLSGVLKTYPHNPNFGASGNLRFFGVAPSSLLGDDFTETFTFTSGKGTNLSSGDSTYFDGSGADTPTAVTVTIGSHSVTFDGDHHGFIDFQDGATDSASIGAAHDTGSVLEDATSFITNSPTTFLKARGIFQPAGSYALSTSGSPYFYFDPSSDTSSKSDLYDALVDKITFTPGVPEPSDWVLMLSGFIVAGMALRRKRGPTPAVGC